MVTGSSKLRLVELNDDLSGIKPGGTDQIIVENAGLPSGGTGLGAEGSQLFKIKGKYYLFNITWPKGGMRTVIIHRADKITGPYEGRIGLQNLGVAQGGLIDMPDGTWYAYLFRDYGAVGRVPYLVPVKWEDEWPVLGVDGKVPETLDLPASKGLMPGIVASDEFTRKKGERPLPLVWQWNHNPDNNLWSVRARRGYLRLTTGRADTNLFLARNTLTQRTFGPQCSGVTAVDVSNMKDGDCAGLMLLQQRYGWIGVKVVDGKKFISQADGSGVTPIETPLIALNKNIIYLKADCDFKNRADKGYFYYSFDGKSWISIGQPLHMAYTIPQFMGYRFGLFDYATKTPGGYVDFDFFRISDNISDVK
jgi:beta-xylosidase